MAKQIRVIQCPRCGSIDYIYTSKDDRYKCCNCDAVYFLEDSDININVNHEYKQPKTNFSKKIIIGVVLFVLFVYGLTTCLNSFFRGDNKHYYNEGTSSHTNSSARYDCLLLFTSKAGKPMLIAREQIGDEYSLIIKDLQTQKIVSRQKIIGRTTIYKSKFRDGSIYLISEASGSSHNILFYVDQTSCELVDVTEQMFSKQEEFASGFSAIQFVYEKYGDGFKVNTSMGEELYYFPKIDKVLTPQEVWNPQYKADPKLPVIIDYDFYFQKFKKHASGIDPKPLLLFKELYYYEGRKTLKTYELLTPDRVYFKPQVLFSDNEELLISFQINANNDSPIVIQSLRLPTMEVNWSLNLDSKKESRPGYFVNVNIKDAIKTGENYYLIDGQDRYYKISKEGILIETVLTK